MVTLEQLQMNVSRMCQEVGYDEGLLALDAIGRYGVDADSDMVEELRQRLIAICHIANSAGIFLQDILPAHLAAE